MIKVFKISVGVIISIGISTLLWDIIKINYSNPENIIGFYSEQKISPLNNLLRFITFTTIPVAVYISLHKIILKENLINSFNIFKNDNLILEKNNFLSYSLYIFLITIFLKFLSSDFYLNKVDYFHEGLSLSSGFNSKVTGLFWSGSFISNSLFSEFLSTKISWLITQKESIGSLRIFHEFLRFLTEIILVFLIYNICKLFNYSKDKQVFFFVILTLIILHLNRSLTELFYPVRYRDIPILLTLIFSLNIIKSNFPKKINALIIGFLSCTSILWSFDRGIYVNILILFLIAILFTKKNYSNILYLIFGIILSWVIFYLFFGNEEIKDFLNNSFTVSKYTDLIIGIEYPKPFDFESGKHAARGTKNLLLIILNGIFISNMILSKNSKISPSSKLYLLFFFITAYINYRSGITRSDGYHMKQAIFFQNILFVTLLINFFIEKINFLNIQIFKKYMSFSLIIFILLFSIKFFKFYKIINFKDRYSNYISKNDDYFLSNEYILLRNSISNNFNFDCIQLFSYDMILPYLLKKKFCTKYNFLFIANSDNLQNDFINQLRVTKTKYIVFNKNYEFIPLIPVEKRFDKVFKYINENYQVKEEILNWIILGKNE